MADSPGIAILVTCNYKEGCNNPDLGPLSGTEVDAAEMLETFERLNYVVHPIQNAKATKADIEALLGVVSNQLGSYTGKQNQKVIIFAFSGHGGNKAQAEKIYANNGEMLDLMDEIVLPIVQHTPVKEIPKLFFIDACRGTEILEKGSGGGCELTTKSDKHYFEKGVHRVEGNYRIDYSTIPNHKAYGTNEGGVWMPKLARALRTRLKSFQNIAANVRKEVYDELGDREMYRQQCESVSRLNVGELYLQK